MSELEKNAIAFIFAISVIGCVMSIVMPGDSFARHWFAREDGLLESVTALALLAAAGVCGYRCWSLRNRRPRRFLLCTAACGAVLLFAMCEEISWGQRILGVETPAFFRAYNAQNETNLHNMVVGNISVNKLVFGKLLAVVSALYLTLAWFYRGSKSARQLLNRLAVPVPRIHQAIAILAIVALIESSGGTRHGEITEFACSTLGLLVLINPKNVSIFRAAAGRLGCDASPDAAAVVVLSMSPSVAGEVTANPSRRAA